MDIVAKSKAIKKSLTARTLGQSNNFKIII